MNLLAFQCLHQQIRHVQEEKAQLEEEKAHIAEEWHQQVSPYLSDLYLANTLSHTSTGQTAGGGEGTLTADGRTADQRVRGGSS